MGVSSDRLDLSRECCLSSKNLKTHASYWRDSDSKRILRWMCKVCGGTVSQATGTPCFGQKRRRLNEPLRKLLSSGMTQRDAAKVLGTSRSTVARKQRFLSEQSQIRQEKQLSRHIDKPLIEIQFDEMETHENSKLKPLSIALAVNGETREILGFQVSVMPAKGLLARRSLKKYGKRRDDRQVAMRELFFQIKPYIHPYAEFLSDKNPKYPKWLRQSSKTWTHQTVKGRRGCVVGQGELKRGGYDPLFSLNHTCAMFRAKMSRLFRRTWNTTKKMECLVEHLWIYMDAHNRRILHQLKLNPG